MMRIRKQSKKRLLHYWGIRLRNHEQLNERFIRTGLLPTDFNLSPLELVCACSLMLERHTVYTVHKILHQLNNECIGNKLDEAFFSQLNEAISELDNAGMRSQARKLRNLGQGIASAQRDTSWQARWEEEREQKLVSAIKDEPFLSQQG